MSLKMTTLLIERLISQCKEVQYFLGWDPNRVKKQGGQRAVAYAATDCSVVAGLIRRVRSLRSAIISSLDSSSSPSCT